MNIYLDDADRHQFLALLARVVETHVMECHAYCLMTNHYHLVATTLEPNVSSAVQALNGPYAQWWNLQHGHVGHVFQGRFSAQVVQDNAYLLSVCRYVVLNPVRAGLVTSPDQWPWSSYRATAGLSTPPEFLSHWILRFFDTESAGIGRARYRAFVTGTDGPGDSELAGAPILGDRDFVDAFDPYREGASPEVPRRDRGRPSLADLFAGAATRTARNARILRAHAVGYSLTEIARYLGVHRSTVSKVATSARCQSRDKPDNSRPDPQ
jgi:REP element-mobilizing transposase RayT